MKEGEGEGGGNTRMLELKEGGRLVAKWILIVRQHGRVRAVQRYDTAGAIMMRRTVQNLLRRSLA